MYLPKFNQQTDIAEMHRLIADHPLGTWAMVVGDQLLVNHIPFIVVQTEDDDDGGGSDGAGKNVGTLHAHLARANPLSKVLEDPDAIVHSIIAFRGEQKYVSPAWYPTKQEHGKVVPTWNYMVVHAKGSPELKTDKKWLLEHVNQLTDRQESQRQDSNKAETLWKVGDAPDEFIDSQLKGIVGVEIPLQSLTGKWKLGQNRVESDRQSLSQNYSYCGLDEMTAGLAIAN